MEFNFVRHYSYTNDTFNILYSIFSARGFKLLEIFLSSFLNVDYRLYYYQREIAIQTNTFQLEVRSICSGRYLQRKNYKI